MPKIIAYSNKDSYFLAFCTYILCEHKNLIFCLLVPIVVFFVTSSKFDFFQSFYLITFQSCIVICYWTSLFVCWLDEYKNYEGIHAMTQVFTTQTACKGWMFTTQIARKVTVLADSHLSIGRRVQVRLSSRVVCQVKSTIDIKLSKESPFKKIESYNCSHVTS